ncbi:MAG: RNA polymerase sigma factor [Clostridiales bacterium]|nr:RNA polymerase sigma factor [Clostridiales bacterium]
MRNLSIDAYNRKKRTTYIPFDEVARLEILDDVDLDEHVLRIEESKEMAKSLADLHQPYADILTLRYYHQLSITEIADVLEITENNVSVRIGRAKKALKGILEKGSVTYEEAT